MKIEALNGAVMASSVYANSVQIGVNIGIKLPDVNQATAEVTAAGGILELPIATKIEAMEASLTKQGIDKTWLQTVTPSTPFDLIANIIQQKVETDGTSTPVHIKAYLRAVSKNIPALEASYGDPIEQELTFSILSYRVTVDGETYLHVDPVKGIFKVNGTNYSEKITAML